jgi:hypothetical protein
MYVSFRTLGKETLDLFQRNNVFSNQVTPRGYFVENILVM